MGDRHAFRIAKLDFHQRGMGRAAMKYWRRNGADRFDVVRISRGDGKFVLAAVIGHEKADDILQLDYDLRRRLSVNVDECVELCVEKLGWLGTICWYVTVKDPVVRISARLAVISVALGLVGLFLGIISLVK